MVVFGFTYLDTLKICLRKEWNAHGVHFLGRGDSRDLRALEEIVRSEQIMGVFTGGWVKRGPRLLFFFLFLGGGGGG